MMLLNPLSTPSSSFKGFSSFFYFLERGIWGGLEFNWNVTNHFVEVKHEKKGGVYADLTPPLLSREVVTDRPSTQAKNRVSEQV